MAVNITKDEFMQAVNENRFCVKEITYTKYQVFVITEFEFEGIKNFYMKSVIIDGKHIIRQTGGNFNKSRACIELIAWHIDRAEVGGKSECIDYFQKKQRYQNI